MSIATTSRRVYFSFYYKRDSQRVQVIRNSQFCFRNNMVDDSVQGKWFVPATDWERLKAQGNEAVAAWINNQMNGCSVLCILFGAETYTRPWVKYELLYARNRGMGILGVNISGIPDFDKRPDVQGPDLFNQQMLYNGEYHTIPYYPVYNWDSNIGAGRLAYWIDEAAKAAGR